MSTIQTAASSGRKCQDPTPNRLAGKEEITEETRYGQLVIRPTEKLRTQLQTLSSMLMVIHRAVPAPNTGTQHRLFTGVISD